LTTRLSHRRPIVSSRRGRPLPRVVIVRLYAATGDGIARLKESGGAWRVELSLAGKGAQCLPVDPNDPDTIFRGYTKVACTERSMRAQAGSIARFPNPGYSRSPSAPPTGRCIAGTEPSRLFRSDDRGQSWRPLDALLELPSRPSWSFPPRLWTWPGAGSHRAPRREPARGRDRARRPDALYRWR
jgi:hypothetical protein